MPDTAFPRGEAITLKSWILATALLGAFLLPRAGVAAEPPVRIALLPLVVHSADDRTYLREGLRDMLLARFASVEEIQVIDIEDPERATARLPVALRTAREVGADFACFGSFTRFGTGASLDVQCASTQTSENEPPMREIFVYSGNVGDVIPDLDELVGKITRFVVHDYEERLAARKKAAGEPAGPDPIAELQRRVDALENAIAELQAERARGAAASPKQAPPPTGEASAAAEGSGDVTAR
jgi:TolB-like protein